MGCFIEQLPIDTQCFSAIPEGEKDEVYRSKEFAGPSPL